MAIVFSKPAHEDVVISKFELPHPLKEGFVKHFGDRAGQIADHRLPIGDGREVHVKEYDQEYSVHWDNSSAIRNPLGHILRDGTKWLALIVGGNCRCGVHWWILTSLEAVRHGHTRDPCVGAVRTAGGWDVPPDTGRDM